MAKRQIKPKVCLTIRNNGESLKYAYRLALPPSILGVHDVFHVSMLRKYVADPSHVFQHEVLNITPEAIYEEQPVQILDHKDKELRNKTIPLIKVLWKHDIAEEATWELKSEMKEKYPALF